MLGNSPLDLPCHLHPSLATIQFHSTLSRPLYYPRWGRDPDKGAEGRGMCREHEKNPDHGGPPSSVPPRHTGLSTLPVFHGGFLPSLGNPHLHFVSLNKVLRVNRHLFILKEPRATLYGRKPSQPFDQQCLLVPQSPEQTPFP